MEQAGQSMNPVRRIVESGLGAVLGLLPQAAHEKVSDEFLRLRFFSLELLRRRRARANAKVTPTVRSTGNEVLSKYVLEKSPPWEAVEVIPCRIPGMLTHTEKKYYQYITGFYSGVGEVVEIGPWLGQSSFYLITSLMSNPNFAGRKLHAFDDFVWRSSWMDKWLKGTEIRPPSHGESFYPIFCDQLGGLLPYMDVRRQKLIATPDNRDVPDIQWAGGAIEFIVIDCGRTLSLNEAWWKVFSPSFIPDRTLIIMQDWQNHKRVPELFWENMKIFTDSKGKQLDLIHEVRDAAIGTFIFRSE